MLRSQDHQDRHVIAGRYELGDKLGVGSSAVVFRATDLRCGREVAIKLFAQSSAADSERRRSREVRVLAGLDHPGLVRLLDGDVSGEDPYLVTELVDGPSLAEALRDGPMPAVDVARVGAQLAEALAVVHAAGLVHRDVKPANVLLDDGRPRLTDFGIARVLDTGTMTTSGSSPGTAAYMAPEQVRGDEVGPPADVYALGLVLLEAAKGEREYPGGAVESAIARLTRPPVVPAGLPAGMGQALTLFTAADPDDRPTAEECATLLAAVETPGSRVAVVWARHWRPATAALAVAGAALALTGMWPTVQGGTGPTPPVAAPYGSPVISGPDGTVPSLPGQADPLVPGSVLQPQPLLAAQEGALPPAPAVPAGVVPQSGVAPQSDARQSNVPQPRTEQPQAQQPAPVSADRPAPTSAAPARASGGSPPAPAPAPAPSRGGGGGGGASPAPAPAPSPAPSSGGGGGSSGGGSGSSGGGQSSSPPPTTGGGQTSQPPPAPSPEPEADRPGRGVGRDGGTPPGQAKREESGKPVPPGQSQEGGGGEGKGKGKGKGGE